MSARDFTVRELRTLYDALWRAENYESDLADSYTAPLESGGKIGSLERGEMHAATRRQKRFETLKTRVLRLIQERER